MTALTTAFNDWMKQNPNALEELREVTADEIRDGLRFGTIVNHRDDMGALVEIPWDTDYSGAFLETPLPTARVDADTLAHVVRSYSGLTRGDTLDHNDLQFSPRGLRMRQVVITSKSGSVSLGNLDLAFPLAFEGCVLDGFVSFNESTLPRLDFDTCLFVGARPTLLLSNATITGALTFFETEGLSQFWAQNATIGTLPIREDGVVLTPEQVVRFTTVLDGARIGHLQLSGNPHAVMPAGDCAGISVDRVRVHLETSADRKGKGPEAPRNEAEWVAWWLTRGTAPTGWRRLGSWTPGEEKARPHERTAWIALSEALTRSGYQRLARRGLKYIDQGTHLQLLAERHRDSQISWFRRFRRWLSLDLTVRYFTDNVRALGGLVMVWVLVSALAFSNIDDLLRGAETNEVATGTLESALADILWAMTYGLNFVVAPLDLGFSAVWPTEVLVLVAFAVLKLIAIALFGLFIVGVSGVVSRTRSSS